MATNNDEERDTKFLICAWGGAIVPVFVFLLMIAVWNSRLPESMQRMVFAISALMCGCAWISSVIGLMGVKTGRNAAAIVPGSMIGILLSLYVFGTAIWCFLFAGVGSFG